MGALPDNSDSRKELEDEIKRLESNVASAEKTTLPTVTLDEISYDAPSDEYLKMTAENSLEGYRNDQIKAINERSAENAKTMANQREAYITNRDSDIAALDESYNAAARAVDNDAVKRGLARSSIAAVNKSELEAEYLKRNADIVSSYGKKISELDSEIAAVDSKLKAALDDFNLTYATKLNEKLAELKNERDKKIEAVTKFNNDVRVKQAALDSSKAKTESDLHTAAINREKTATSLDGLTAEERDGIYKSVYEAMDAYLGSMDKQQAKMELLNHSLYRQHLSNYYYYKLMDKYGRYNEP